MNLTETERELSAQIVRMRDALAEEIAADETHLKKLIATKRETIKAKRQRLKAIAAGQAQICPSAAAAEGQVPPQSKAGQGGAS